MAFTAYLVKKFDYTHENTFFRNFYSELKRRYSGSEEYCILIGNLFCNNHEIDALFIKSGQISIIEFKDYGGRIEFSENNPWKIWKGKNFVFIGGGSRIRNPFQQVRAYRYSLIQFLESHQQNILEQNIERTRWDHIACFVLFQKEIEFDNNKLPQNISKYFSITDSRTIYDHLFDRNSPNLTLTNNEIESILRVLDIRPENIFDDQITIEPEIRSIPENKILLAKKLLPEQQETSNIKRVLQYYRTIINLESYKETAATEIHTYAINWNDITDEFRLTLSLNPDFHSIFLKNLQDRFPRNLFIGVNVLVENSTIPILHTIRLVSEIEDKDEVVLSLNEFSLFKAALEKLGLPEDQIEELITVVNDKESFSEKIESIESYLGINVLLLNSLALGLSQEGIYSVQLLSELKKLIQGSEDPLKEGIISSFLLNEKISPVTGDNSFKPFVQITSLNRAQKKSLNLSFSQPLTVITGPPGTGKSQLVLNIIANAIVSGRTVLFASKNNKAVDTVRERMDELLEEKYLLRFGTIHDIKTQTKITIQKFLKRRQEDQFQDVGLELSEKLKKINKNISESNNIIKRIYQIKILKNEIENLENDLSQEKSQFQEWKYSLPMEYRKFFIDNDYSLSINKGELTYIFKRLQSFQKVFFARLWFNLFLKNKIRSQIIELTKRIQNDIYDWIESTAPLVQIDKSFLDAFISHTKFISEVYEKSSQVIRSKSDRLSRISSIEKEIKNKKSQLADLLKIKNRLLDEYDSLNQQKPSLGLDFLNLFIKQKLFELDIPELQNFLDYIPDRIPWRSEDLSRFEDDCKRFLNNFSAVCVQNLSVKNGFPLSKELFDLVVIDEASQCDIASAIPLVYRAKKLVIIGDPLQLKHITSVTKEEGEYVLDQLNLTNFNFNYVENSLFDFCDALANKSKFEGVFLNEHYRSYKDIINYSISNFYEPWLGQTLLIQTKPEDFVFEPVGITWHHLNSQVHDKRNVNIAESEKAIKLAAKLIREYPDASIGIVTPFRHQYKYIFDHMPEALRDKVKVDDVHKYQGDEKDIMIFSLVISDGCKSSLPWFINEGAPYLLNVAVTRARSSLFIVGNFDYCKNLIDRNGPTLLSRLANYVEALNRVIRG